MSLPSSPWEHIGNAGNWHLPVSWSPFSTFGSSLPAAHTGQGLLLLKGLSPSPNSQPDPTWVWTCCGGKNMPRFYWPYPVLQGCLQRRPFKKKLGSDCLIDLYPGEPKCGSWRESFHPPVSPDAGESHSAPIWTEGFSSCVLYFISPLIITFLFILSWKTHGLL